MGPASVRPGAADEKDKVPTLAESSVARGSSTARPCGESSKRDDALIREEAPAKNFAGAFLCRGSRNASPPLEPSFDF